jgi:hypothetical protein
VEEMLKLGIIRPSNSPMASPIICVQKGKDGKGGTRIAVDLRFVNKYTVPDEYPTQEIGSLLQRMGNARYISTFNAKSGYWQTPVNPQHTWLLSFICDMGLFEFTRTPFGAKNSGATFSRAIRKILRPIRAYTDNYVDDMCVYSNRWKEHLIHLENYLKTIRDAGVTLSLAKSSFAKPEVKFCGQIVGSGTRRPDPDKIKAVQDMRNPRTKTEVRQILGFFSYFREYLSNFSEIAKPLTDLTAKRIPANIQWEKCHQKALDQLKDKLCQSTMSPLFIINFKEPFELHVDASDYAIASLLTQKHDGVDCPIAFSSAKLTKTQRNWSVVEKEAHSALQALHKFRGWIFDAPVILHSDHNPLTYLTQSAPKSPKLMRWALALQQYKVTFRYRRGSDNAAADCLSRLGADELSSRKTGSP